MELEEKRDYENNEIAQHLFAIEAIAKQKARVLIIFLFKHSNVKVIFHNRITIPKTNERKTEMAKIYSKICLQWKLFRLKQQVSKMEQRIWMARLAH